MYLSKENDVETKDKASMMVKIMDAAYRSDMEHGIHWLNDKARLDWEKMYPEISKAWDTVIDLLDKIAEGEE
jgi:hypothetical protein